MPGTVLRAGGTKIAVTEFLRLSAWKPLSVYWKGVPRFKSSTHPSKVNGFNVDVSSGSGLDLPKQVRDALRFMRKHKSELARLKRLGMHATLDFGVEVRDKEGPAFFRIPTKLIGELATHGIDLEISYYGEEPR